MQHRIPLAGIGCSLFLLAMNAAVAKAQTPTDPAPQAPEAESPADVITLPDNEKEPRSPNFFQSLLSLIGLPKPGQHLRPGFDVFSYTPTSSAIQNRFGTQWTGIGLGLGRLEVPQTHGVLTPEIGWASSSKNGDRATLVPLGARWQTGFGDKRTRGTVGFGSGLLLLESRTKALNQPSRWRGGVNGSVFAGLAFGGSGSLEVGYRWATPIRGMDLSGTTVNLGVRF